MVTTTHESLEIEPWNGSGIAVRDWGDCVDAEPQPVLLFRDLSEAQSFVNAMLATMATVRGMQNSRGWYADTSDEPSGQRAPAGLVPWRPYLQFLSLALPLPVSFDTEAACERFIVDAGLEPLPTQDRP